MTSIEKPKPRKSRGVVARFLAGESVDDLAAGMRRPAVEYFIGQLQDRVEAILRRALQRKKQ